MASNGERMRAGGGWRSLTKEAIAEGLAAGVRSKRVCVVCSKKKSSLSAKATYEDDVEKILNFFQFFPKKKKGLSMVPSSYNLS